MAASLNYEADIPPEWVARFLDDIPTGVAVFDRELRYVAANGPWATGFGLAVVALAGQRHDELDPVAWARFAEAQRRALAGEVADVRTGADGRTVGFRPYRARDGAIVGVTAALQESVADAADRMGQDGPDPLTGIAGRDAFLARLRDALAAPGGADGIAMFLLNLGDFKGINDLYGARVGDRVLQTIAARLAAAIKVQPVAAGAGGDCGAASRAALVARAGADEFGVVLGRSGLSPADAEAFARHLLQLVVIRSSWACSASGSPRMSAT